MPGIGPAPKHPSTRARTNKTSTVAYLQPVENPTIPPIPSYLKWRPETRKWWKTVWSSPMAGEFDDGDVPALGRLAILIDAFYAATEEGAVPKILSLSAEIRLQEQRFGLSPMDRRRLQWTIEQGEEAAAKTKARQQKAKAEAGPKPVEEDPRAMLA